MAKAPFKGTISSIQPRIRLNRSFDEVFHEYLGFALYLRGWTDSKYDWERDFSIGIGKVAHAKHQFKAGDEMGGECLPVDASKRKLEPVEYYKVSKLKVIRRSPGPEKTPPPWEDVPPDLEKYRERGHRKLAQKTYNSKCFTCIWGCRMPVEITVDHWNPGKKQYRYETFCYGPLSCGFYKAGPKRKVPGRKKGMVYIEEDRVDEEMTRHRDWDE